MSEFHREKDPPHYHVGAALTPFNKPGQSWDAPIGSLRARAYVWRRCCFITLGGCVGVLLLILLLLLNPGSALLTVEVTPQGFVNHYGWIDEHDTIRQTSKDLAQLAVGS